VEGDDINTFAGKQSADRLVLTVGKFSVADVFDTVKYAHDPRSEFLNWTVIEAGTFDYAADPWGYTYGAAAEWYQGPWALRGGLFDLSVKPNNIQLDHFHQFQIVYELERRHEIAGQPGSIMFDGFVTRGRMGRFDDAIVFAHWRHPKHVGRAPLCEPHRLQPQFRAAGRAKRRRVRPGWLG
jgi:high affinity Mn2+ porin